MGDIPEDAWRDPYLIGFVGMLITLVAKVESGGRIGDDPLALAQLDAWSDITGEPDGVVGQEICLLSLAHNADFARGCHNARRFMKVFHGAYTPDDPADPDSVELGNMADQLADQEVILAPEHAHAFGSGGLLAAALWERYFDRHIA